MKVMNNDKGHIIETEARYQNVEVHKRFRFSIFLRAKPILVPTFCIIIYSNKIKYNICVLLFFCSIRTLLLRITNK